MFRQNRLIAGLLAVLASGVASAQQYTIVDLGTLGGSNSGRPQFSAGNGINFFGQVTGSSISTYAGNQEDAFLTSTAGGMTDLGTLVPNGRSQGLGVNSMGQVTGNTTTNRPNHPVHAFITDPQTNAMIDLGTLACGTDNCNGSSYGAAINDSGQVAGYSTIATSTSTYHAFVTDPTNDVLIDLGAQCDCASEGLGINVYGDVTGWTATTGGVHAFFSGAATHTISDIGTLGGSASTGRAINNNQQITGDSLLANGTDHAFLWTHGGMQDLGTLGGAGSQGNGLSTSGLVTGKAQTSSGEWHAFLYSNGAMTDLNDVIGTASRLYTLTSGQAINDQGQIVVNGTEIATGLNVAFLLTPPPMVPQPTVTINVMPTGVVAPGELVAVSWYSHAATSCAATGSWSATGLSTSGEHGVQFAKAGSYPVTVTCTGPGGSAAATMTIAVVVAPTLNFTASDIPVHGTTVLTWAAFPGATTCTAAGAWSGTLPVSGSRSIGPLAAGGYNFQISCTGPGVTLSASQGLTVFTPGELSFLSFIPNNPNVAALASPGTATASGGLDGHGYAYNSQALARPLAAFGETFYLGNSAGTLNAVAKQTIQLSNFALDHLTLLATGVNGNQPGQPFVIHYSDGTSSTYVQSVSDWHTPQHYPGEVTAAAMTSRVTPSGGTQSGLFNLYAYRIPVDGTKGIASLTLPSNRNVIVLAINMSFVATPSYYTLSAFFNVNAVASAGQPAVNGGLDGHGYAFDSAFVPTGFSWSGQQFPIGPANLPDAIAKSTVFLDPNSADVSLTVLATGVNGSQPDQTFLVTYTDGSTTLFKQSVSDWGAPQHFPGEAIARTTVDRITPTGGRQGGHWNLYAYTFQVDHKKPVMSVTLPKNRNVIVFSINGSSQ